MKKSADMYRRLNPDATDEDVALNVQESALSYTSSRLWDAWDLGLPQQECDDEHIDCNDSLYGGGEDGDGVQDGRNQGFVSE